MLNNRKIVVYCALNLLDRESVGCGISLNATPDLVEHQNTRVSPVFGQVLGMGFGQCSALWHDLMYYGLVDIQGIHCDVIPIESR